MRMFRVGGCVRDDILGLKSKDIDFACEVGSFEEMRDDLILQGFTIFLETPQFLTIRARFPRVGKAKAETADFVMCRKDGFSSDHRRPDQVFPGTIMDDLARRDFTMNAIAIAEDGAILDPFFGREAIADKRISFVGGPMVRIREDALRAVRGLRFAITKGFVLDSDARDSIDCPETVELLKHVSSERIRDELTKMFTHDTLATMDCLHSLSSNLMLAIMRDFTLVPSMKEF